MLEENKDLKDEIRVLENRENELEQEVSDLKDEIRVLENRENELEQEVSDLKDEHKALNITLQNDSIKLDLIKENWEAITISSVEKMISDL